MKIVAVIPARGNSKSIKGKNTRSFCGKPLLAWTILSAKKSKDLDRIIVSTEDPEVAKIAKKYGAETPFIRPAELSVDQIGIEPIVKHTYQWLIKNEGYKADALILLLATNPFRQSFHIDEAIKIFKKKKSDSVVSVNETPANHTPFWTLVKSNSGKVTLYGGIELKQILDRRQDFPHKCYARNDLLYLLKPKNLYDRPPRFYGRKVELYETDPLYEVDLNTPEEWALAEIRFKKLIKNLV